MSAVNLNPLDMLALVVHRAQLVISNTTAVSQGQKSVHDIAQSVADLADIVNVLVKQVAENQAAISNGSEQAAQSAQEKALN